MTLSLLNFLSGSGCEAPDVVTCRCCHVQLWSWREALAPRSWPRRPRTGLSPLWPPARDQSLGTEPSCALPVQTAPGRCVPGGGPAGSRGNSSARPTPWLTFRAARASSRRGLTFALQWSVLTSALLAAQPRARVAARGPPPLRGSGAPSTQGRAWCCGRPEPCRSWTSDHAARPDQGLCSRSPDGAWSWGHHPGAIVLG